MLVDQLKQELLELKQELLDYKDYLRGTNPIPFKELEFFLSDILDVVPHHVVFIDGSGIITLCNQQAAADLGLERDKLIGKHIRDMLQIPDEQIKMLETLRTGKPIRNQEVLDRNYGIMNTKIIRNHDFTVERVVGVFQYLNHVKEAEKQAITGRIAAGIAHEIRNPLTTVRGYLQLLESRVDKETASIFSHLLIPELDRANKIITDFLRIAKPSEPTKEILSVKEFFSDYLAKFLTSEALMHNVLIQFDVDDQSASCQFVGDKEELFQVFINLYRNSLQAQPEKQLIIKITTEKAKDELQIYFSDNGVGISPNLTNHIFDPFFTTKDDGTGLGLSVSKKILETHSGKLELLPSVEGACFRISIPIL